MRRRHLIIVRLRALIAAVLLTLVVASLFVPTFWRVVYPIYYLPVIQKEATAANINPLLVAALVRVESNFHEDDISHAGAVGLMQLMPSTASWVAGQIGIPLSARPNLENPEMNVRLGSWYMAYLLHMFHDHLAEAIAAYNAGPNRVQRWLRDGVWSGDEVSGEDIPVLETRHFLARVLYTYQTFRRFY